MTTCSSCVALQAELAQVRAEYELERSRRTLGGTPMRVGETWENTRIDSPEPGAPIK